MYYPVLRLKKGELNALKNLTPEIKANLQPVFLYEHSGVPPALPEYGLLSSKDTMKGIFPIQQQRCVVSMESLHSIVGPVGAVWLNWDMIDDFPKHLLKNKLLLADIGDTRNFNNAVLNSFKNIILQLICEYELSIVLIGTSVPVSMSEVEGQQTLIPRKEWQLFQNVIQEAPNTLIHFGDYSARNSSSAWELPPGAGKHAHIKVRYTTNDSVFVVTIGSKSAGEGFQKFHEIAKIIVESDNFSGADFSYGDKYIFDKQIQGSGTGNFSTWITAEINHHITLMVRQLS